MSRLSFQEEIRCLNSHNSELRSQLEVLSSRTRDSSGTPDMRGDDSAETTPPPLGGRQTPSMSESPRPPPSPSPSASSSFTSSSSPNNVTPPASLPTSHSHGLPVRESPFTVLMCDDTDTGTCLWLFEIGALLIILRCVSREASLNFQL